MRARRLERVTPQSTIDRNDGVVDVARERRGQKDRQHGEALGLAMCLGRNFRRVTALAVASELLRRIGGSARS